MSDEPTFYHDDYPTRMLSFEAVKDAMLVALQPTIRQLSRHVTNGLPIREHQFADIKNQLDTLENWLRGLKMVGHEDTSGRRRIARPTRQTIHSPGDSGYDLLPPAKE